MASSQDLPKPVDLSHHVSRNAQSRVPSSMKSFYKYFAIPGIGQLAGGPAAPMPPVLFLCC